MKKGDSFKVDSSWWEKEGAWTLEKETKDFLGAALKDYETKRQKFERRPELASFVAVLNALDEVDSAREGAIKKCKKGLHDETKAALSNVGSSIKQETMAVMGLYSAPLLELVGQGESDAKDFDAVAKQMAKAVTRFEKEWDALFEAKDDKGMRELAKEPADYLGSAKGHLVNLGSKNGELPPASKLKDYLPTVAKRIEELRKDELERKKVWKDCYDRVMAKKNANKYIKMPDIN
ncbi:MAG: hypothetical protein K2Y51_15475 [Gammaproteobacteria bacterium]|nr:hypothetical protein [Gammaproteobacteria bacterium]